MSVGVLSRLFICAAALAAGCATQPADAPIAARAAPPPAVEVRDVGGAWTADPRWTSRVGEIVPAARPAADRLAAAADLAFETGREPLVVFDETAPREGDVAPRFVDGVRRPVIRIAPRALVTGEFRAADDLGPLVVAGAMLAGAADREPPAWVVRGVAVVVGGSFDRMLHRRALAGPEIEVREEALFGVVASDPLAAAARAKALARCARSERPFARFLALVLSGRSEDAALAEVGIGGRTFLDAAADTERSRAARAIADDPLLPVLRAARAALREGDAGRADAALASQAGRMDDATANAWLTADARLCLAEIAVTRGELSSARASYAAATATSKVVRLREARVLEVCIAAPNERPQLLEALLKDFPDAATSGRSAELLRAK